VASERACGCGCGCGRVLVWEGGCANLNANANVGLPLPYRLQQVNDQMKTNEDLRLRINQLEAMLEVQANAVGMGKGAKVRSMMNPHGMQK
jgi:hypothetical protein